MHAKVSFVINVVPLNSRNPTSLSRSEKSNPPSLMNCRSMSSPPGAREDREMKRGREPSEGKQGNVEVQKMDECPEYLGPVPLHQS